jgi:DNA topoisomerase-2
MQTPAPQKVKFLTFKEHVGQRSMWIGSYEVSSNYVWVRVRENNRYIFRRTNLEFSEALLKCFDEILVNAVDQYINVIDYPESGGGPVTFIKTTYDKNTGMFMITNNGQGMPVYKVEDCGKGDDANMVGKYSVEGLISHEYSGSNFDDKKNPHRVTGGVNGLGMKLININCLHFEVETVDYIRQTYYRQVCKNRMEDILPPTVVDLRDREAIKALTAEQRSPHTTVRFLPDYANLCKKTSGVPNPDWFNPQNAENFCRVIEARVYEVAAFIASIDYRYQGSRRIEYKRKAEVYFNNEEVRISNLLAYAKMFDLASPIHLQLGHTREQVNKLAEEDRGDEAIKFPWQFVVGINPAKKFEQVCVVNAVHLEKGGSHVEMMINQIIAGIMPKVERMSKRSNIKLSETILRNLLFIIDCKQIPIPQFAGQTKESLKVGLKDLNKMKKSFVLDKKDIDRIWKALRPAIEQAISTKEQGEKKKKLRVPIRKYIEAEKLGMLALLWVPEGDSAAKIIRDIIHSRNASLSYKTCGMYNIQGVPMNARKKIRKIYTEGKVYIQKYPSLMKNIGLQGLVQVLGLDYDEDYYYGPPASDPAIDDLDDAGVEELYRRKIRGDAAFEKLNYGKVIIATDQDLDGIGHICSLLLVFIMCIWPELIKRGFIQRLATPIIRVYQGTEVKNFYSEKEYKSWASENFGGDHLVPKNYKVKYYKGLSTHTEEEVLEDIGVHLLENIYTFTWDDCAEATMELLYGQETKGRKEILLTPVDREYNSSRMARQVIPCSDHFLIESKSFQLEFMRRKLKNAIDGFVPSQRKAFAGARRVGSEAKCIRVYQLTGYVSKNMGYAHGDAAMNETITKMSQNFTGSNNIPPFVAISNGFGDRVNGRGVTGSPRYIDTRYNAKVMNLLFPREDDYLLDYIYEEGVQCEPVYYVPILPYAILETTTTAGVGWKISCWARDLRIVLTNVRKMIEGDYPAPQGEPESMLGHPWLPKGMDVVIGQYTSGKKMSEICVGTYEYDEDRNEVIITQLPLKQWSYPLTCRILGKDPTSGKTESKEGEPYPKKEFVRKCIDHTANDQNHIIVQFREGAIEAIEAKYDNPHITAIEEYLEITQQMDPHLNMMVEDGCIQEFETYEDILRRWFPLRRELYQLRIQRQIILLQLKIELQKNTLRYINMDASNEINIDKDFEDEVRDRILEEAGFRRFNRTLLLNPKYTKVKDIERLVYEVDASYEYIDSITVRMKSKRSVQELEAKIAKLEAKLKAIKQKTWKILWLEELEELEKIIRNGRRTKWLFRNTKHKFK